MLVADFYFCVACGGAKIKESLQEGFAFLHLPKVEHASAGGKNLNNVFYLQHENKYLPLTV
jgi:hypothetical protein